MALLHPLAQAVEPAKLLACLLFQSVGLIRLQVITGHARMVSGAAIRAAFANFQRHTLDRVLLVQKEQRSIRIALAAGGNPRLIDLAGDQALARQQGQDKFLASEFATA